jgi:hypothetical protein
MGGLLSFHGRKSEERRTKSEEFFSREWVDGSWETLRVGMGEKRKVKSEKLRKAHNVRVSSIGNSVHERAFDVLILLTSMPINASLFRISGSASEVSR